MARGIILINKSEGMTSRYVDNKIQRLFSIKKVGHLGTLDPFATGLLIIAIGEATKALPYIDDSIKRYTAIIKLGIKTDTGDLTGKVIKEKEVKDISINRVNEILKSFIGKSKQLPPMTSAIHYNGKRLYEYSREGIEVNRKQRDIEIYNLSLNYIEGDNISITVSCSKGTYVRVLAEDIAHKLDTVGHLISLNRVSVGHISISDSVTLEELDENKIYDPERFISYKHILIEDKEMIKNIKDGKLVKLNEKEDVVLLIYKDNDKISSLAIYKRDKDDIYRIVRGLW